MTDSAKRIGLIGLSAKGSWASRSHLHYLQNTSNYRIAALQNSSKTSAEAAAKQYSLENAKLHDNPKSLADDSDIDIVAVSVKVPQHYDLIKPALEAGKDVFSEWPLGANLQEAIELTDLAKQKGVRTMVGLQARQSPSIIKAKEIVESGKLGKILGTTMYGHGMIFGPTLTEDMVYLCDVKNGANLVTIPFGHAVDAFCYVLGEMESLSATLANHRPEATVVDGEGKEIRKIEKTSHDYISVTGTLVNGAVAEMTYAAAFSRTGRNFYWEINGTEGSLIVEGNFGHIQMFTTTLKFVGNEPGAKPETIELEKSGEPEKGDFSYNVGKAWDAWAGAGKDAGHTVTTFEDAVVRHRMIDAIYRSAEKGTRESYL
ncbi:NAD-binding Rossmann fold oxidoreductase family protein [Sporormia fimetaria CBS 119925]|uniref:NAD-binding Rossmann fold oxidoreductase family protein n=1 Tax=Sporormia fimetaria CBS 119925 TaxID=1340428 RepID=A0A6A6V3L7_9PLEO|nr:NAD-binding Rossmann fold oxidoreductase family protein [Sporormia fimetaria CBS 119925]